jgi:tetratricopeptide (TPR) repeat protein
MFKKNGGPLKALEPELGPADDDVVSPLKGKPLGTAITIIGVAVAIPGGLYVLLALVIAPLFIRGFLNTARRRREKGNLQDALDAATLAVRLKRKSATARAERALIYFELGQLDAAAADITHALERRPHLPLALYVAGRIAEAREEAATALAHYGLYLEHDRHPGDARHTEVRDRVEALGG